MKKTTLMLLAAILLFIPHNIKAQETKEDNTIYEVVSQMPEFPGGMKALTEYLDNNIKYPKEAEKEGIQGNVYIKFVIKKDGNIDDIKIIKGIHPLLDAEAIRVIKAMPKWIPGRQNDKPVNIKHLMPITFSLNKGEKVSGKDAAKDIKANVMPQFPGGMKKLFEYISDNIKYPKEAAKDKIQGRVIVQFVVNKDGNIKNANIAKGKHPLLDAEALRIVMTMPKWIPGKEDGEYADIKFTLPVIFKLPTTTREDKNK